MRPHVGAVMRDIDWNISHDANVVPLAANLQALPLSKKFELCKLVDLDLGRQFLSPLCQRFRVASAKCRVPIGPDCAMMKILCRHEQSIVIQPRRIFCAEHPESSGVNLICIGKKNLSGFAENSVLKGDHRTVVDPGVWK